MSRSLEIEPKSMKIILKVMKIVLKTIKDYLKVIITGSKQKPLILPFKMRKSDPKTMQIDSKIIYIEYAYRRVNLRKYNFFYR